MMPLSLSALDRELMTLDGLAQIERVRKREISPSELLDSAIARSETINPFLNAINRRMYSEARAEIEHGRIVGPLAPLPYLLKDIFSNYAGVPTTAGSHLFVDDIPDRDAELVRRLRLAGLVLFGKATTSEFGSLPTTEATLFGPTHNAWKRGFTAGGSSGGGAAAVAARIVPAAQGSDGAGSIRIPASCCGLVGLKPTRGRISLGPDLSEGLGGTMAVGSMTLSVRDTAALLDATEGPMIGDPYWAARPDRPFLTEVNTPPGRLRIALTRRSLIGTPLHPECVRAVDEAAKLCAALGHDVEEAAPSFQAETYVAYYKRHWQMSTTRTIRRIDRQRGGSAVEQVDPFNRHLFEEGIRVLAADYIVELEWLQQLGRTFNRWQEEGGFDVWLTPTLGRPPVPHGWFTPGPNLPATAVYDRFMEFLPFTPFANLSGQPAISLPLSWTDDGLPVGVHFTAHYGEEATLLRLSSQIEEAQPWMSRIPDFVA